MSLYNMPLRAVMICQDLSEWVEQFVDTFFGCIRSNSMAGIYNVTNGVHEYMQGSRWTQIDELTMVSAVFLDK